MAGSQFDTLAKKCLSRTRRSENAQADMVQSMPSPATHRVPIPHIVWTLGFVVE
jgi:hypothetical protein